MQKEAVHVRLISFFFNRWHDRLRLYIIREGILFNYTLHYALLNALKRHVQTKMKFD